MQKALSLPRFRHTCLSVHRGGRLVRGENEADRIEALLAATKKRAIPASSGRMRTGDEPLNQYPGAWHL
jgi:hypothetical protein